MTQQTKIRIYKTKDLLSADPTIIVPDEVHVYADGRAVACHAASGDVCYDSLAALEAAYEIEVPAEEQSRP